MIKTAAEQKTEGNIVMLHKRSQREWVQQPGYEDNYLCTQMLLFTHVSAAASVEGENQEWEKEIKRKEQKDYTGYVGVNGLNQAALLVK